MSPVLEAAMCRLDMADKALRRLERLDPAKAAALRREHRGTLSDLLPPELAAQVGRGEITIDEAVAELRGRRRH